LEVNLEVKIADIEKSSIISAQVDDSPSATLLFHPIPNHKK